MKIKTIISALTIIVIGLALAGTVTYARIWNPTATNNTTVTADNFVAESTTSTSTFAGGLTITGGAAAFEGSGAFGSLHVKSQDGVGRAIHIEEFSGTETWELGISTAGNLLFFDSLSSTAAVTFEDGGNVGIGISPISNFHTYQDTASVDAAAGHIIEQDGAGDAVSQYLLTGAQRWVLGVDNSDSDSFKIASSEDLDSSARLTIDTGGDVGIGSTTPFGALTVQNTSGSPSFIVEDASGDTTPFTIDDGGTVGIKTNSGNIISAADLQISSNGPLIFFKDLSTADTGFNIKVDGSDFQIDTRADDGTFGKILATFDRGTGNLNIGEQENPDKHLTVTGSENGASTTIKIANSEGSTDSTATLIFGLSTTLTNDNVGAQIEAIRTNDPSSGSSDLVFSTTQPTTMTEVARFDANGRMGLGTTSPDK